MTGLKAMSKAWDIKLFRESWDLPQCPDLTLGLYTIPIRLHAARKEAGGSGTKFAILQ